MQDDSTQKLNRTLGIYSRLMGGAIINKQEEADRYKVALRSIQRDIEDIRNFLMDPDENDGVINNVVYDRAKKGYRLERIFNIKLTNPEVLSICKILLDSRSLTKPEMDDILRKLIECCVPLESRKVVRNLISNEQFHYIQPKHGKVFMQNMWDIGMAIESQNLIEFSYQGVRGSKPHERVVEPAAIMNADMYFYMVGFIQNIDKQERFDDPNDLNPTIYRIDRIQDLKITSTRFSRPYKDRFQEGEFRKRIQFMFGGKLRRVRFKYKGYSMEAVEDRLPTARVISTVREEVRGNEQDVFIVEAEVYGDGIDMWFRQQGDMVEVM
ncbi:MAG: WYL domain-containing protein [Lachnospiraceae bacterium]|nr:WYL domain-containing protein [Lachnospiraceae bacterium]